MTDIPELPSITVDDDVRQEDLPFTSGPVGGSATEGMQDMLPPTAGSTAILDLSPSGEHGHQQARTLKELYDVITAEQMMPRKRFHYIMYGVPALPIDAKVAFIYSITHITMIFISVALFVYTSMPEVYENTIRTSGWAFILESITVGFFTIDFILRIAAATRVKQVVNFSTLVDFASFMGFYIELIIVGSTESRPTSDAAFVLLRVLRLFRVFRLFKLSRSHRGLAMMVQVIEKSKDGLLLLVLLVLIAVLVFSSILYYIELTTATFDLRRELWIRDDGTISPFQSIPHTFWFIAVSITTVGYGEEVPYGIAGRAWATAVMLFGVLVLSFPNILIGSNFSDVHRSNSRTRARRRLGIYFRRVRMVVRFIRMWREFRVKGKITLFIDSAPDPLNGSVSSRRRSSVASGVLPGSPAIPGSPRRGSRFIGAKKLANFFYHPNEFPEYRDLAERGQSLTTGNIEGIEVNGLPILDLLQRLLEGFSSCATIDELSQCYLLFPFRDPSGSGPVRLRKEIIMQIAMYTSAANLTVLYVLNRDENNGLLMLTAWGIDVLQNFSETRPMPCMRCYSEARDIWAHTVKQVPQNFLPIDGYRQWQKAQKTVARRSGVDFTYDLKLVDARRNDIFASVSQDVIRQYQLPVVSGGESRVLTKVSIVDRGRSFAAAVGGDSTSPQMHRKASGTRIGGDALSRSPGGGAGNDGEAGGGAACRCRHCALAAAQSSGAPECCFEVDEEFLELEVALAQARLEAFRLAKRRSRSLSFGNGDNNSNSTKTTAESNGVTKSSVPTVDGEEHAFPHDEHDSERDDDSEGDHLVRTVNSQGNDQHPLSSQLSSTEM